MARYPVDTPDRAELIAADMQTKHASTTINVLVSSIESEAGIGEGLCHTITLRIIQPSS